MGLFTIMLILHIAAGSVCLLTGAIAFTVRKKRGIHTMAGEIYHGCYVAVFITSIVMAAMHWQQSSVLFYIALFSYGLALFGYLARKVRWKNWIGKHIRGMLGSYIGVVTAVLVVNGSDIIFLEDVPVLLLWFLPTIIGTPIIVILVKRNTRAKKNGFSRTS